MGHHGRQAKPLTDPSHEAALSAAGQGTSARATNEVALTTGAKHRTQPSEAALALVYKQFSELWAKFTTERATARRHTSDPTTLERIDVASELCKLLRTFLAQVHIARTAPASKQVHPRHLALSGTYKSLWCAFQQAEPVFVDDLYDLFAVHEKREFVSFGGVAGRCYVVVIRDLVLKHLGILADHSIQGHVMPSCESVGVSEYDWIGISDQTVERFTPDQFEAVNRAFDEIDDFNYGLRLASE